MSGVVHRPCSRTSVDLEVEVTWSKRLQILFLILPLPNPSWTCPCHSCLCQIRFCSIQTSHKSGSNLPWLTINRPRQSLEIAAGNRGAMLKWTELERALLPLANCIDLEPDELGRIDIITVDYIDILDTSINNCSNVIAENTEWGLVRINTTAIEVWDVIFEGQPYLQGILIAYLCWEPWAADCDGIDVVPVVHYCDHGFFVHTGH